MAGDFVSSTSSYPTYEEWKLKLYQECPKCMMKCSYPTYEEWKRSFITKMVLYFLSSYPTYEEWKPPRNFCASSRLLNPFLSYL